MKSVFSLTKHHVGSVKKNVTKLQGWLQFAILHNYNPRVTGVDSPSTPGENTQEVRKMSYFG